MNLLETFNVDFQTITNDGALAKFLEDYALTRVESAKSTELARHVGSIDGKDIVIIHIWYNPKGPFSMEPEINKLELLVNGRSNVKVSFSDE